MFSHNQYRKQACASGAETRPGSESSPAGTLKLADVLMSVGNEDKAGLGRREIKNLLEDQTKGVSMTDILDHEA